MPFGQRLYNKGMEAEKIMLSSKRTSAIQSLATGVYFSYEVMGFITQRLCPSKIFIPYLQTACANSAMYCCHKKKRLLVRDYLVSR